MELFVIIVNVFQPLTINTKSSILDVAAVLNPPLRPGCCIKSEESLYPKNYKRTQLAFTSSKLTIETLEEGVNYVQS